MASYASAAPHSAGDGFRMGVGQVKTAHAAGNRTTGTLHSSVKSRVGKDAEGAEHKRLGRKGRGGYGR